MIERLSKWLLAVAGVTLHLGLTTGLAIVFVKRLGPARRWEVPAFLACWLVACAVVSALGWLLLNLRSTGRQIVARWRQLTGRHATMYLLLVVLAAVIVGSVDQSQKRGSVAAYLEDLRQQSDARLRDLSEQRQQSDPPTASPTPPPADQVTTVYGSDRQPSNQQDEQAEQVADVMRRIHKSQLASDQQVATPKVIPFEQVFTAAERQRAKPLPPLPPGFKLDQASGARPETGTDISAPSGISGQGTLRIDNGTGYDALATLKDAEADPARRTVYIRAHDKTELDKIGPCRCDLYFELGAAWDAGSKAFRANASYEVFNDPFQFAETETEVVGFSVTLHPVPQGQARTTRLSKEEFERRMGKHRGTK